MKCSFVVSGNGDKCVASCSRCGKSVPVASCLPPVSLCRPGLGDMVKSGLSAIGITEERVSAAIGRPCGCSQRAEALNELGRKIGIG
jgi:hypothetical protein